MTSKLPQIIKSLVAAALVKQKEANLLLVAQLVAARENSLNSLKIRRMIRGQSGRRSLWITRVSAQLEVENFPQNHRYRANQRRSRRKVTLQPFLNSVPTLTNKDKSRNLIDLINTSRS